MKNEEIYFGSLVISHGSEPKVVRCSCGTTIPIPARSRSIRYNVTVNPWSPFKYAMPLLTDSITQHLDYSNLKMNSNISKTENYLTKALKNINQTQHILNHPVYQHQTFLFVGIGIFYIFNHMLNHAEILAPVVAQTNL